MAQALDYDQCIECTLSKPVVVFGLRKSLIICLLIYNKIIDFFVVFLLYETVYMNFVQNAASVIHHHW